MEFVPRTIILLFQKTFRRVVPGRLAMSSAFPFNLLLRLNSPSTPTMNLLRNTITPCPLRYGGDPPQMLRWVSSASTYVRAYFVARFLSLDPPVGWGLFGVQMRGSAFLAWENDRS